jgi:3-oxoacyl-[acyl-carrier protein] reductase
LNQLLASKSILITGASKGIGKATALLCAEQGASLVLLSRNSDLLNDLKQEIISKYPAGVLVFPCDITKTEQLENVFKQLNAEKITIDCLVNNAGIMQDATLLTITDELIKNTYETNVFPVIHASRLAVKNMLRKRKGSIINITSIIGINGHPGNTVYGSSKAAVVGITKSLSKELAPLNIRVNAVAPGFIETELTAGIDEKFREKNLNSIGMKRFGKPEDVAKAILFLASDLSEYVTGQVIGVDGSMVI